MISDVSAGLWAAAAARLAEGRAALMVTSDTPTFGDLLRRYRVLAGLTQEALAERAHVSTQAVRALEQGINRAPRAATLALLAEALALSAQARAALVAAAQPDAGAVR